MTMVGKIVRNDQGYIANICQAICLLQLATPTKGVPNGCWQPLEIIRQEP
jgi:hypothetical protein